MKGIIKRSVSIFMLIILLPSSFNIVASQEENHVINLWNSVIRWFTENSTSTWVITTQELQTTQVEEKQDNIKIKTAHNKEEEIDLNAPKNKWFTLEEIKKIYKYSTPIDKLTLYELDESDYERHNKILKRLSKYDDDDLVWIDVNFPNHINSEEIQDYIEKYNVIETFDYFYSWPDTSAYFTPEEGKTIKEQLETWKFRKKVIGDLLRSLEYVEKKEAWEFKDDITYEDFYEWEELESRRKHYEETTKQEREYLYQIYHRWLILKAMKLVLKKKDAELFLKDTWVALEKALNISARMAVIESLEKKNSHSQVHLNGDGNIPFTTSYEDTDGYLNQSSKESIQKNMSTSSFSNLPTLQSWAPEYIDLSYNLEDPNNGTIKSFFLWWDHSWFNNEHSWYEHDIRVTSKNFIDCKETNVISVLFSDVTECDIDSIDVKWENTTLRNFWYIDTRYLDEENTIFTIWFLKPDKIVDYSPYKVDFQVKKIWDDKDVKIELLNELTHYAKDVDALAFCKTRNYENMPEGAACMFKSDGSFTYIPNKNFIWKDRFSYKANDGKLDSNIVFVEIIVKGTPPSITMISPSTNISASSSYKIFWEDYDPYSMSTISLYYSKNNSENDGILIKHISKTENQCRHRWWNFSSCSSSCPPWVMCTSVCLPRCEVFPSKDDSPKKIIPIGGIYQIFLTDSIIFML